MSVAVEKRVGEPIIILKPDAQVSMQELIDAWFCSSELAQTMEVPPHRIVDLRLTHAQETVVSMIQSVVRGLSGSPVDVVLNVSFVGRVPAVNAHAEEWFETLDDALDHIHATAGAGTLSS